MDESLERAELPDGLRRGEPGYARAVVALLAAGLASFNALYCTQALMPALTHGLGVDPAQASLTVSATTGVLALAILPASVFSERYGRGRVIAVSALSASVLGLLLPWAPDLTWLVAGRAVQGLLLAGVPATAMAWLSEEIHGDHLAPAMGQYVAGTTIGGLLGRLIPSGVLEFASWRWALAATTVFAALCAAATILVMPAQRRFVPKQLSAGQEWRAVRQHWRHQQLAGLFLVAFVLMGVFVSVYDFLGYRLVSSFGLREAQVGSIFLLYLFGTAASAVAGRLTVRHGRPRVLLVGAAVCVLSLPLIAVPSLWAVVVGTALFTTGFFTAHAVASGWVGALAVRDRAEASGTYLACYYLGSSVVGYLSGVVFHRGGWSMLVLWLTALSAVAVGMSVAVARGARSDTPSAPPTPPATCQRSSEEDVLSSRTR
ncbi:Inner membrane transport protein YnfM [Austwickia sp. TVS 96-490-7B]|uniref:MFS transporter n=1 Tax=Austwickia sp. TVS 96-490-7B TaxID=2830843 RepID=UPI001C56F667|nr:MFS transporter [Austwickia sp. TVS 96-490-7B]MBW3085563.1 Inner membrane transport protein YnfM [Austwickia sp. TVS 96-490-7B]